MKDALRSLGRDPSEFGCKRGQKHLAVLKKLVGDEHWPWAERVAGMLMRHFGDPLPIERLGESALFSLSHGAVPLAAEQLLSDIARFEGERGAKR
jgi:hypothetical protein